MKHLNNLGEWFSTCILYMSLSTDFRLALFHEDGDDLLA